MNDHAWIDRVIAAAEPLEDRPAVRAIWFDDFGDVLRFVRAMGIRDESGRPMWKELKRQARGDARLLSGTCSQGESLAGAYTAWVCREPAGRRHTTLTLWVGSPSESDFMERKSGWLLNEYRDVLARRGEFPVNSH
jgi:hypothetical protein